MAGKLQEFYLAGGTALSLFYFKHRESYDLDFFTSEFSREKIEGVIRALEQTTGLRIELTAEHNQQGFARILVYYVHIDDENTLKIDFVEDRYNLLEPLLIVDGIPVLSREDIYLRKILTACGSIASVDTIGRRVFIGGRQEAKDFFDLYFLSKTFTPLSKFVNAYCRQPHKESIIIWFRTYDRLEMKVGLTEIMTDKSVTFQEMERHFKEEVDKIISAELE
ncbi:MAG: nucleotidyl transferase AbiEii/AbiGii toxin family protein [Candidatus Omnitrophica bacterium]|nr:nucleotidyl transferase AbiEii/AbiGii toxin family protein [Candidatus Omnitrophota bacterium]